jgi:hypothetical protein
MKYIIILIFIFNSFNVYSASFEMEVRSSHCADKTMETKFENKKKMNCDKGEHCENCVSCFNVPSFVKHTSIINSKKASENIFKRVNLIYEQPKYFIYKPPKIIV